MKNHQLELDILSGGINPVVNIDEAEFNSLMRLINNLESIKPISLFDGLGFRGFILKQDEKTKIVIQQNNLKMSLDDKVSFKKNNDELLNTVFNLFEEFDEENEFVKLLFIAKKEYKLIK